jgi:FkbM family methyltransferase
MLNRRDLKNTLRPYVLAARRLRRHPPTITSLAWSSPVSYSQFGEDRFLLRHFGERRDGFYVDVGAYHPFDGSNTFLLYQQGWRGINLEPAPDGFEQLRRHRRRDINLPIAVSSQQGHASFVLSGSFAGIEDEHHLWPGMPGKRITVVTEPLSEVLDRELPKRTEIDLLDVDCEGRDLDVLRSNDWDRFRPALILAEAHTEPAGVEIIDFLASVGYRLNSRRLFITLVFERADGPDQL